MLTNYGVKAGWFIPFVNKRVGVASKTVILQHVPFLNALEVVTTMRYRYTNRRLLQFWGTQGRIQKTWWGQGGSKEWGSGTTGRDTSCNSGRDYRPLHRKMNFSLEMACFDAFWTVIFVHVVARKMLNFPFKVVIWWTLKTVSYTHLTLPTIYSV